MLFTEFNVRRLASVAVFLGALSGAADMRAAPPLQKTAQLRFPTACGTGLDQNSPCGNCIRVGEGPLASRLLSSQSAIIFA
jgi:hypothetical protein